MANPSQHLGAGEQEFIDNGRLLRENAHYAEEQRAQADAENDTPLKGAVEMCAAEQIHLSPRLPGFSWIPSGLLLVAIAATVSVFYEPLAARPRQLAASSVSNENTYLD
jgi:hypothetical protein